MTKKVHADGHSELMRDYEAFERYQLEVMPGRIKGVIERICIALAQIERDSFMAGVAYARKREVG